MEGNLIVYKASAGSGKTYTLAAEYIARLLAEDPLGSYAHLLAVTFTNKATTEMKERILQQLWNLAETDNDFIKAVGKRLPQLAEPEIRRRAGIALKAIIHDYDHFRVETIDSFFQSLLSNLAHELNLAANFKVDINDREVIEKAVNRLMTELEDRPDIRTWVMNYIRERIDENRKWDITREVKLFAHNLLKEVYLRNEEEMKEVLGNSETLTGYRLKLKDLAEGAADNMQSAAEQLDDLITDGIGYESISNGRYIKSYLQHILDGGYKEPSASVLKFIDKADNWLRKADKDKGTFDIETDIEPLREVLSVVEDLRSRGAEIINSCRLSTQHINPLRLLNEIAVEMDRINEENHRFMLAKTPLLFHRMVGKDDASFVFEKAGTTFQHVMIDEFQDTSTLQWENFKKLLVENMAKGNGCLLVGDTKQGIYRFRGGDWNILQGIGGEFANGKPEIRDLDTNFRSARGIVEFNNGFFPKAAKVIDSIAGGTTVSELYQDATQKSRKTAEGYIRITTELTKPKKKGAQENEAANFSMEDDLAEQILRLNAEGVPFKKMAILVRYNSSGAAIQQYFAAHYPQIPLVSDEAFLLSSSTALLFLINALRYLNDAGDTIALAYINQTYRNEILGEARSWQELVEGGKKWLPEEFAARRSQLKETPLYELCETLISIFDIEKIKGCSPYIFCFLDQVMSFLEDNPSDIGRFLTHWDETLSRKSIPSGKIDGVYILTIHKSKGLDFHTVLLPYCDWELENDRHNETLWCEPTKAPYNEIPLLPISTGKSIRESVYSEKYNYEHLQRRIENLNLLYVAFTRAQQNMLVWCEAKERKEGVGTMGDVIYQCLEEEMQEQDNVYIYERGSITNDNDAPNHAEENRNPLKFEPQSEELALESLEMNMDFKQSNSSKEFVKEKNEDEERQAQYISRGKLLHKLFSLIHTGDDVDRAIDSVEMQGIIGDETNKESLRKFIAERLKNPQAAQWFDGTWRVFNESTILSKDADKKTKQPRPDRVMIGPEKTIVVDFKFGKPDEAYREQVRRYIKLLKDMGQPKVEGYLWYMYKNEIERVEPKEQE